ncbi:cytochrome b/b6 domain-containing protein [uncultured Tenacibaculum sp.]|uniref:cytochrome b n=1 Tax=uncultured Tenacibaculum sp. TaxID=174713 RepID=UPI0026365962|nr:cytochrome b/b6 domain-containing protein [uncultured Tenacibaculum sp.]
MKKINNLTEKYSKENIIIHWFTAVLILILFPLGKYMETIPTKDKMNLIIVHIILGGIVFFLTLFRSYLFFTTSRPKDLITGSKFNDKLAIWIHNSFYFLLIGISIAGILTMFYGGYINAIKSEAPTLILKKDNITALKAHSVLAVIMIFLLMLHVLGVIKHYFLTKENTLKRIS